MDRDDGKVFIGGISWGTTEETLTDYFSKYGDVSQTVIMRDKVTGRPRGFGFVVFSDPSVVDTVLQVRHTIEGRTVEAKRALSREEQQTSRPGSNVGGSSGGAGSYGTKKIFVRGLPATLTEEEFRQYFESYGDVTDVVIMFDRNTKKPRGFGFITFDTEDAVDRVLQKTFHELNNKAVEVKRALPKDATPGGGGGLGGYQGSNSSGSFNRQMDGNRFVQQSAGGGYPPYSGYGHPSYGFGGPNPNAGYGGRTLSFGTLGIAQHKGESNSAQKSVVLVLVDPSGDFHAINGKAYLWTTKTKTPAYRLYKDKSLEPETFFGFSSFGIHSQVEGIVDEKYLTYFDLGNEDKGKHIKADTYQSLQQWVEELNTSDEYEVNGNSSQFWINTTSGQVYTSPNGEDLVKVLRKDFRLFNKTKNMDLRFSIFEEAENDDTRIGFIHFRSFERLMNLMDKFGIEKKRVPFETLRVRYDTRFKRDDGLIMYKGVLTDPYDREFENKFVMVQEVDGEDENRIKRFYFHLGSHPNLVNVFGIQEFEGQKFLIFEEFDTLENFEDLDKILRSILLGALHIYKKDRIHGKLQAYNVVCSFGEVKLFGAMGHMWTTKNAKQELSNLGTLLDSCICKIKDMQAYIKEDPVACDIIQKLKYNRITLPTLIRHHYLWKPEDIMKFLYDVTNVIDDRKHNTVGHWLEVELKKPFNENRVYMNKKSHLHRKYFEHMELNSKFWTYKDRSLSGLMKLARNTYGHETQLNPEIRGLWGSNIKGLGKYWCGKNGVFPCLPIVVFDIVEQIRPKGGILEQYTP